MDEVTLTSLAQSAADMARSIDTVWVLVTAALVFFMQAGFALVEAGFTRSKNTVNILYKNLMDFAVGSIIFWALGFGLMFGADISGIIGTADLFFKNGWTGGIPAEAFLIFQTVFAATAATIVSGAMAERTEFKSYLMYSLVISAVIYPVSGHWIWGGGWLSQLSTPFVDFAGSTVVHMVGGVIALTGALALGPRLGKYSGKKVNAIPGHSMVLGTLGVFILWIGWFGFNPGSQLAASGSANATAISHIFITTNMAGAAGALAGLAISWIRWRKPSLSFALNGALAGLVGVTAGCAAVTATGAIFIGLIAGTVLVFAVTFIDNVLKIDDPVGAVSVHGVCGALGTILVGFFSESGGLLYGHGTALLVTQLIGVASVAAWAGATGFILFKILKATVGLRVPKRIEEEGLDIYEHGESAYN
ncbi:MAG TPA: ammonium transporter [Marinilabiliales bacterium]|nr:ammonium transporter [Marinilabiliales bacterium]